VAIRQWRTAYMIRNINPVAIINEATIISDLYFDFKSMKFTILVAPNPVAADTPPFSF
jgi:hypothetical protein